MEIKMNKEIRDYKEKVISNFTIRQIVSIAGMLAFSLFVFQKFYHVLSTNTLGFLIMLVSIPFILLGDFLPKYNGMNSDLLALTLLRYLFEPKQLKFVGSNQYRMMLKESTHERSQKRENDSHEIAQSKEGTVCGTKDGTASDSHSEHI